MRKVVVTGGAGFIGSHLVDFLVKQNINEIVIFDNPLAPLAEMVPQAVL